MNLLANIDCPINCRLPIGQFGLFLSTMSGMIIASAHEASCMQQLAKENEAPLWENPYSAGLVLCQTNCTSFHFPHQLFLSRSRGAGAYLQWSLCEGWATTWTGPHKDKQLFTLSLT